MSAKFHKNGVINCTPIDGYDKMSIMKNDIIVGENLCTNTRLPKFIYGAGTAVYKEEQVNDDGLCFRYTCTTAGTGGRHYHFFPISSDKIGKTYTWSMDVKANRSFSLSIGHECGGVLYGCTLSSKWKRYYYTWTFVDNPYNSFVLYPNENAQVGDWIEVKNLKIEEGSKATPWCPNPADGLGNTPDIYKNPIQANNFIEL